MKDKKIEYQHQPIDFKKRAEQIEILRNLSEAYKKQGDSKQ